MADNSVLLGRLADDFTAKVRAGQMPDIDDYARQNPEIGERIRALFPTLMFLEGMAAGKLEPSGDATTLAPAGSADLAPGQIFNQYRIERELGRGGMGVVYEAIHLPLNKRVALKVMPIFNGQPASHLERFLREAQTAAGLHHTNIVPVFDIGQANNVPYYAMQFIDGRGLDVLAGDGWKLKGEGSRVEQALTADHTPGSADHPPPSPADLPLATLHPAPTTRSADFFKRIAQLGIQAADALAYAHERGVIHRDIKPSNLLLDKQGVLWITDFGLARRAHDPALTHSGALVGTPRYMSPEQAESSRRLIDHRTDIYSLGATLYELVTCRPPFSGKTPTEVVLQIIDREPIPPRRLDPAIPRDLETIITKAMAKQPKDRYQTAAELSDDLRRWLKMEPIKARRIGPIGRASRWCRRNPRLAAVTGAAAVIILFLSIFMISPVCCWLGISLGGAGRSLSGLPKRRNCVAERAPHRCQNLLRICPAALSCARKRWPPCSRMMLASFRSLRHRSCSRRWCLPTAGWQRPCGRTSAWKKRKSA
jgi:serine/threonine protein kinase